MVMPLRRQKIVSTTAITVNARRMTGFSIDPGLSWIVFPSIPDIVSVYLKGL
jgi:hypothetical protein